MPSKRRVPTLREVAELAGVSVQTVSSVVNNKPGYTDEMRARVQAAVQKLGYRPFAVARSLRTRETRTLALVVSDIANPSFATMASAAEDYAHLAGYSLVLYNTHDDVERERNYIETATQRWVDGAVFVSAEDHMPGLEALQPAGIPIVAIDRIPDDYTGPAVTLDNVRAGRLAADHLLALGHTTVAHIAGPLRLRVARERLQGFQAAIAEQGLAPAVVAGGDGNWGCEWGYRAMQQVLQIRPLPSAAFAANDRMAIGAARAVYEAGLRVPDDISLVALDDIEVAAYQIPPLTTIRQPFASMATQAVHLLLEILDGHPLQQRILVQPDLVVRRSTAAPA